MNCKVALVGLPNAGKSTLFQGLTELEVVVANYPFATINPNVGTIIIDDPVVHQLSQLFPSARKVFPAIALYDIAGLIRGASQGEGLGNQFLAQIRTTHVICCLVRCFTNKNVPHVNGTIDPVYDVETIFLELINADQSALASFLPKLQKQLKKTADRQKIVIYERLSRYADVLAANDCRLWQTYLATKDNLKDIKVIDLLTTKPILLCGNIDEAAMQANTPNEAMQVLQQYATEHHFRSAFICADFVYQLSQLEQAERLLWIEATNLPNDSVHNLITQVYQMLDLKTFYTAGPQEVRAWSFPHHATAQQCAGIIHSDFAKNFIKAEVYSLKDLLEYKSEKNLKKHGKIKLIGRDQAIEDQDVVYFRVRK